VKKMKFSFAGILGMLAVATPAARAQSTLYSIDGSAGDQLGASAQPVGDVDADAVNDLVVASRFGASGRGYVRWISGSRGTLVRELTGAVAGDEFGAAVASIEDADGDCVMDLLVGAPGASGSGAAYVVSGASGSILRTFLGSGAGDRFGASVCGLGDVNGDGHEDYAIGAPLDDDTGADCGSATVFSGADGAMIRQHDGVTAGQFTGWALAAIADLNGDGVRELAVGEPVDFATTSSLPGRVRVFSGASGVQLFVLPGSLAHDHFGTAIADAGDIDSDGFHEIAVGAPQHTATGKGYVRVYSGFNAALLAQSNGDSAGDRYGTAIAAAGDADGDGVADLWIGAPRDDVGGTDTGSVRLVSASGATLATIAGRGSGALLGGALGGGIDVNGDGIADGVLASPGDSSGGAASGSVLVVSALDVPLTTASHLLPLASATPMTLQFDAGPTFANARWFVLGSIHGSVPGIPLDAQHLPLNPGRYLEFTSKLLPVSLVQPPAGQLDASGRAAPAFSPWISPSWPELVGMTFHHAIVVTNAQHVPVFISNAAPITLTP
jgi:hypothetical protein